MHQGMITDPLKLPPAQKNLIAVPNKKTKPNKIESDDSDDGRNILQHDHLSKDSLFNMYNKNVKEEQSILKHEG